VSEIPTVQLQATNKFARSEYIAPLLSQLATGVKFEKIEFVGGGGSAVRSSLARGSKAKSKVHRDGMMGDMPELGIDSEPEYESDTSSEAYERPPPSTERVHRRLLELAEEINMHEYMWGFCPMAESINEQTNEVELAIPSENFFKAFACITMSLEKTVVCTPLDFGAEMMNEDKTYCIKRIGSGGPEQSFDGIDMFTIALRRIWIPDPSPVRVPGGATSHFLQSPVANLLTPFKNLLRQDMYATYVNHANSDPLLVFETKDITAEMVSEPNDGVALTDDVKEALKQMEEQANDRAKIVAERINGTIQNGLSSKMRTDRARSQAYLRDAAGATLAVGINDALFMKESPTTERSVVLPPGMSLSAHVPVPVAPPDLMMRIANFRLDCVQQFNFPAAVCSIFVPNSNALRTQPTVNEFDLSILKSVYGRISSEVERELEVAYRVVVPKKARFRVPIDSFVDTETMFKAFELEIASKEDVKRHLRKHHGVQFGRKPGPKGPPPGDGGGGWRRRRPDSGYRWILTRT